MATPARIVSEPEADGREVLDICARIGTRYAINGVTLASPEDVASACLPKAWHAWQSWDGNGKRSAFAVQRAKFAAIKYQLWLSGRHADETRRAARLWTDVLREDVDSDGRPPHVADDAPAPDQQAEENSEKALQLRILEKVLASYPSHHARAIRALLRTYSRAEAGAEVGISEVRVTQILKTVKEEARALRSAIA